jgi:post-segregation antitoxin (ccd killing protein)
MRATRTLFVASGGLLLRLPCPVVETQAQDMSRDALKLAKRPVNLSVSGEVVVAARGAGVNLSALLERAATQELVRLKRLQWREKNAGAICAYNEYIGLHGTCFEGRWGD